MSTVSSPFHRWENEASNRVSKRAWSWLAGLRSEKAFSEAGLVSRTVAAGSRRGVMWTLCDQEAAKSRAWSTCNATVC